MMASLIESDRLLQVLLQTILIHFFYEVTGIVMKLQWTVIWNRKRNQISSRGHMMSLFIEKGNGSMWNERGHEGEEMFLCRPQHASTTYMSLSWTPASKIPFSQATVLFFFYFAWGMWLQPCMKHCTQMMRVEMELCGWAIVNTIVNHRISISKALN